MRLALLAILFLGGCGPIVTAIEWGDVNAHRFDKVPRKPLLIRFRCQRRNQQPMNSGYQASTDGTSPVLTGLA
jgi:hypothetical protein